MPGTNTYTIFAESPGPAALTEFQGINLFFEGRYLPDISALVTARTVSTASTFTINASADTFGMDGSGIFPVQASGSIVFSDGVVSVSLVDCYWAQPSVFNLVSSDQPRRFYRVALIEPNQ